MRFCSSFCVFVTVAHVISAGALAQPIPSDQPRGSEEAADGRASEAESLQTFTLGEVVVTTRKQANIEQAATTTVVDSKRIEQHNDMALDDTLEMVPGIQVYTHTKGHRRIRLRSFDQDRIAILLDGIPLQDVFASDVDVASIPVTGAAKVIINRGISSALYGTDGAVGSVNVITRRPRTPFARVGTAAGTDFGSRYVLAQGMPIGSFYYLVEGSIELAGAMTPSAKLDGAIRRQWFDRMIRYDVYGKSFEDLRFPAREQYISDLGRWDHFGFNRYAVSARSGYDFGSIEAGMSVRFSFFEGESNTYQPACISDYNLAQEKWRINRRPWFGDEQSSVKDFALRNRAFLYPEAWRVMVTPYLHGTFGNWSVKVLPYALFSRNVQEGYADVGHKYVKDLSKLFSDRRTDPFDPFRDIKEYGSFGVRAVPSYRFGPRHQLNISLHYRYDTVDQFEQALSTSASPNISELKGVERYRVAKLGSHLLSVAIEDEVKLWKRLKLSAGCSYDAQFFTDYDIMVDRVLEAGYVARDQGTLMGTRDSVSPVFGAVYEPWRRRLRVHAAAGLKARFPTLSEYAKIATTETDTELVPERAYSANAGLELLFYDRALSFRADYFATVVDDRIAKLKQSEAPVNIERVAVQGVEVLLSGRTGLLGGVLSLSGDLSYLLVHGRNHDNSAEEQVNKGDYLEYLPPHQVTWHLLLEFASNTSLVCWGRADFGAQQYVMAVAPEEFSPYSTDFFTTVRLHDPIIANLRIAQGFLEHYEAYVAVHNLLDDYDMDPFNPGPGRTFLLGAQAAW
jgi:outer membrane receptor protein involved in Fe transport